MYAFIGMPGPMEIAVIIGVCLLIFGPSQIPKVARSVGSIIPSFRKGMKDVQNELQDITDEINNDE